MRRVIRKQLKKLLLSVAGIDARALKERELISKAARFVACEMIE